MRQRIEQKIRGTITDGIMAVSRFNRSRMRPPSNGHPYLTGIHRPVQDEKSLSNLLVTGTIPPELDGRYLRIGPNPAAETKAAGYNWFLGDGMIHGVRLKDGQALWYKNRWVRTTDVSEKLGETAAPGPRNRGSDSVNTNIIGHAGRTWALVEAGAFPVEIGEDLETIAHDPFGGSLSGAYSAHPHLDPATGELHAICYYAFEPDFIRHIVVDAHAKVTRNEPIKVKNCPSIHDCAITTSSVIVFDLPVTLSMKTLIAGHGFPFRWDAGHSARIGILPRNGKGGEIEWRDIEPCYLFHANNAFDNDDGSITVDVVVYDTIFSANHFGPDNEQTRFERWIIPADRGQPVARKVIDASPQEFPRFDERCTGLPYRYAYCMPLAEKGQDVFVSKTHLLKHDLGANTKQVHEFGEDRHPGEFVFVPKHDKAAEDDGWLVGFVIDRAASTTDLVILNAQDFEGPPQAQIHIPHLIPPGFHGNWIAAQSTVA